MSFLIKFYNFMTMTWNEPTSFGLYHILCILTVAGLTVAICKIFKDCSDKTLRRISAIVWIVIVAFELYKNITYGFDVEDGRFVWDYPWYIFPFQFCSSPLYIIPIIAFAKDSKLRDCCLYYMMTFSFFAGFVVFCYPNDVFVETVGINLQTMLHHGSQIMLGAFYATRYRDKLNVKRVFDGAKVFVGMVLIAMVINIVGYHLLRHFGADDTFNMFYISPYFPCTLPLLDVICEKVPYIIFVMIYFFGFILCAYVIYWAFVGIKAAINRYISAKGVEKAN